MTMIIDARGLDCPHPVVLTNKAFEESDEVTTIVDNAVAKENVSRLAKSKGFAASKQATTALSEAGLKALKACFDFGFSHFALCHGFGLHAMAPQITSCSKSRLR